MIQTSIPLQSLNASQRGIDVLFTVLNYLKVEEIYGKNVEMIGYYSSWKNSYYVRRLFDVISFKQAGIRVGRA